MTQRRDFLKAALATGLVYGTGALPTLARIAEAGFAPVNRRILVNVMLAGGPDFRHLFPPAYNANAASFGFKYWEARARSHDISTSSSGAWQDRWVNDYFPVSGGGTTFGILRNCGWLKRMYDQGNVAIVANAIGSSSRDHDHSISVLDQGNLAYVANATEGSGWGGRLAKAAGGNAVALTPTPRRFCYGPHPNNPQLFDNSNMVSAADMRNVGLYKTDPDSNPTYTRTRLVRSLSNYYRAKRAEVPRATTFGRIVDHERRLRQFEQPINNRLATLTIPTGIEDLYSGGVLSSSGFGVQIRNLYDALACNDVLNMRAASLEYNGWDSHKGQRNSIEPKLSDMFGDGKAFDTLYQSLPADAKANMTIVIAGEFGRQLKANGDSGTDHGRGNYMLIIGQPVNGGVYGNMFPAGEIAKLNENSPDIDGKTDIDRHFGAVCEWVHAGSANVVFPNRVSSQIEGGVSFGALMS
jgi:uncharacterized protein (DUF1501 family)